MLFAWITDPNAWLALGTLTLLEIVLGIDNIIFLSLVVAKLPTAQRNHARRLGLAAAMVMRLALLASIAWVTRLTNPLFELFGEAISARDLILLLGGLFLIWKASKEIHEGTVAKLAMRQPFVLFKGLTFQKLCLPGAFRPGDHHNKMLRPGLCVVHASPQYL